MYAYLCVNPECQEVTTFLKVKVEHCPMCGDDQGECLDEEEFYKKYPSGSFYDVEPKTGENHKSDKKS